MNTENHLTETTTDQLIILFEDTIHPFKPISEQQPTHLEFEYLWQDFLEDIHEYEGISGLNHDILLQYTEREFDTFIYDLCLFIENRYNLSDIVRQEFKYRITLHYCRGNHEYIKFLKSLYYIDINDQTFYWIDFVQKWNGVLVKNPFSLIKDLMRVYSLIISGKTKSVQKVCKDDPIKIFQGIPDKNTFSFLQNVKVIGKKCMQESVKSKSLQDLINSFHGIYVKYGAVVFNPHSVYPDIINTNQHDDFVNLDKIRHELELERNNFNQFRGFRAKYIGNVNMELIEPVLRHIREVWAGNNDKWNHWILSWFSWIFKYPSIKTEKVLTLVSEQGAGKNLITDWIENDIIGLNAITISTMEKITQRFNSVIEGKLLITLNEVSKVEGYKSHFDKFKSLVTERRQAVERKGLDIEYIKDCCNYIILSNNEFCVYVENGDRRYAMPDMSNKYKKNREYFTNLYSSLNEETANHFYSYLLNYDGLDVRDENNIPQSELKTSMIDLSLPSSVLYVKEMLSGDYNIYDHCNDNCVNILHDRNGDPHITKADFYKLYTYWCNDCGRKSTCKDVFYRQVKSLITDKRPRFESETQRPRCVSLPTNYTATINSTQCNI